MAKLHINTLDPKIQAAAITAAAQLLTNSEEITQGDIETNIPKVAAIARQILEKLAAGNEPGSTMIK